MDEFKYNIYFTQLLINIKNNKDISQLCQNIDEELSKTVPECKLIFLSQFTNNTIKLFNFHEISQVNTYIGQLQGWLEQFSCIQSLIDIHYYALMIQYIIITRLYFPEMDLCFKNASLNQILDNINLIKSDEISIVFLNYCLQYYLNQGISIIYKDTCNKIVKLLEDLLNKKDSKLKLGIFNLPLLESELK